MADYDINKWDDTDYTLKDSNNHVILLPYPFLKFGYTKDYRIQRGNHMDGYTVQYSYNKLYVVTRYNGIQGVQCGFILFENEAAATTFVNKNPDIFQYSRTALRPDDDHEYLIRPLWGWKDSGYTNEHYAGSMSYDYFWLNVAKEFETDPAKSYYLSFGNCFISPYHNGGYTYTFGLVLSDPNTSGYSFTYAPNNVNTRKDTVTFPKLSLTCLRYDEETIGYRTYYTYFHKTFSRYYKDSNVFVAFTPLQTSSKYDGRLQVAFCVINFLRNGNKFQLIIQDRTTVYVRDTVNKSIYKTDGLSELFDFKSVSTFPITSGDPRYNAVTFKVQGSPKDYILDSFNDSARFITLCAECGDSKGIIRPDSDKIKFLVLDENLDSTTKNTEILNSFADADSTAYKSGLILLLKGNEYHPPVVLQVPKEEWLNNENIS